MRGNQRTTSSLYGRDGRRKYLTPDERAAFIRHAWRSARPTLTTFCLVLAYCGCRISEALTLRGRDINVEECFVAFITLKKRGEFVVREVPVPIWLVELLCSSHRIEAESEARLWPWSRSRGWFLIKSIMIEAGIALGPHQTAKGLRHAFGIHAVRSGVPLNMVQRWLGHASLATTAIYTQAVGHEERELAARMWTSTDDPGAQPLH